MIFKAKKKREKEVFFCPPPADAAAFRTVFAVSIAGEGIASRVKKKKKKKKKKVGR